jgi:hypothetical protein
MPKSPLFLASAISLATVLSVLPSLAQIESVTPGLPLHPYALAGGARYKLLQGDTDSFSYALGAEYEFNRFLAIDLGYVDFGTAYTENITEGLMGLVEVMPNAGQEARRRAGYVLPTFRVRPFSRVSLSLGAGPALVETRSRSYTVLGQYPKVSTRVRDERHVEWLGKVALSYEFSPSWTAELAGYAINSDGLTNSNPLKERITREPTSFRSYALLAGLRYSTPADPRLRATGTWAFDAGPVVSRLSYHANYVTHPLGYNFAIRHRWASGFTLELGRTDYGQSNETPRYPDGSQLRTPPYSNTNPYGRNDLQIEIGSTYGLCGAEIACGKRWTVGLSAGGAHTVGLFYGPQRVFLLRDARYNEVVTSWDFLSQFRAQIKLSPSWCLSLGVRYHEFGGPQITLPDYEPDFGNTKVRLWTFLPQLSMKF